MDKKLIDKLAKKYPKLFEEYGMSPRESCMAWGCECGNGWYQLLDELFEKLSKFEDLSLAQVKEKFGTLRVYTNHCNPEEFEQIHKYINEAERKSAVTCDQCGKTGKRTGKFWIRTICNDPDCIKC